MLWSSGNRFQETLKSTQSDYWDFDVAPVSSNPKYMKIFQMKENRYA